MRISQNLDFWTFLFFFFAIACCKFLPWPFPFLFLGSLTLATFCVSYSFWPAQKVGSSSWAKPGNGTLINYRYNGPFYHHFCTKTIALFFDLPRQNASVSKTDCCADRSILALLSAYQEYLVTFKLMTSQVVQRAGPLRTFIYVLGSQGVKK